MKFLFRSVQRTLQFFSAKKEDFYLAGFIIMPVATIIRIYRSVSTLRGYDTSELASLISSIILIIVILLVLFYPPFSHLLKKALLGGLSSAGVQVLLCIALLLERVHNFDFVRGFQISASLTTVGIGCYNGGAFTPICQLLFLVFLLYRRLRIKYLNLKAFREAGIKEGEGPISRDNVLFGLSRVISLKLYKKRYFGNLVMKKRISCEMFFPFLNPGYETPKGALLGSMLGIFVVVLLCTWGP